MKGENGCRRQSAKKKETKAERGLIKIFNWLPSSKFPGQRGQMNAHIWMDFKIQISSRAGAELFLSQRACSSRVNHNIDADYYFIPTQLNTS